MLYIEVSPLLAERFTGIPQLTWHLVRYWLQQADEEVRYFVGNLELDPTAVEAIVSQRTGRYHQACHLGGMGAGRPFSVQNTERAIALYPHTRPLKHRFFRREIRLIHDLTFLLTPEMHPSATVATESYGLFNELDQIDHIVCVSNATRDDLILYCGVDAAKTSVAYPGVQWFDEHASVYEMLEPPKFDRYALVLGTFEPRKNIRIVFEYLRSNPDILDDYTFCFCGTPGWGEVFESIGNDSRLASMIDAKRVRVIPFVNEHLKFALLKEAAFLVYPSFIEGFGSPVAEALSLGVPAVVSFGGSLPEVAGEAGYYFDPYSVESLAHAIERVTFDLTYRTAATRLTAYAQGAKFSWSAFNETLHNTVRQLR